MIAAAAVTESTLTGEAAAIVGSLIIAVAGFLSAWAVWVNRKVARRLNEGQTGLAHAQAGKTTVEAVMLLLDRVQLEAESAMRQAQSAERQVARLRKWANEVDAIVRAHGISIPPLPDLDDDRPQPAGG